MEQSPFLEEAERAASPLVTRTLETPFLEEPEGIEQQLVPAAEPMDLEGHVENMEYLKSDDQESTEGIDLSEESDIGWEEGSAWETVASGNKTARAQDSQGEIDTVESEFFITGSTGDPEIESEQAGDAGEAAPFGAHGLILGAGGVTQLTDFDEQSSSDANTIIPGERSVDAEVMNDEAGFIQEEATILEDEWAPELEDQEVRSSTTQEDRAWIHSLDHSAIERLPDPDQRQRFLAVNWSRIEFPGNGPDTPAVKANWNLADALFNAMAVMTPERRVPMLIKYRDVDGEVTEVPGQANHKLFAEARDAFVRMRDAAAADGVELIITSSWRSRKRQEELRRQQPNAKAVAKGVSAHMYGLAVDLRMSVKGLNVEANTRSPEKMAMLVRMYRSPVFKWMALRGREFGWFPYRREPWHWEYNPVGFKERFEGLAPVPPPRAPTLTISREPGPHAVGRAGAIGVDLGKAVRLNSTYADRLGWRPHRESIASLLGLGASVDDESFARAVAEFQEQKGMTPADGILGPKTWAVIESLLKGSPAATAPPDKMPVAHPTSSVASSAPLDLQKAKRLNKTYATRINWGPHRDSIARLLGLSPATDDDAFASALAEFQRERGITPADGILGPRTWTVIESLIGTSIEMKWGTTLPKGADGTTARIEEFQAIIEREAARSGIDSSIIRGIIAAESGGDPNRVAPSGYKGLMQADRDNAQLDPQVSIRTGAEKFKKFRDVYLGPRLKQFGIDIRSLDKETMVRWVVTAYNAGHVTVLKAVEYATGAGNPNAWMDGNHYDRALLFSGGYSITTAAKSYFEGRSPEALASELARLRRSSIDSLRDRYAIAGGWNVGALKKAITEQAHKERDQWRFGKRCKNWQKDCKDPPADVWTGLSSLLRHAIEFKRRRTPGYVDKIIRYITLYERDRASALRP